LRGAPDAENTFDAPTNVHTVTVPVRLNNAAVLEYEVPAMSVTTIRIKKGIAFQKYSHITKSRYTGLP
jgi:alpha-L-arabinofuranosidase